MATAGRVFLGLLVVLAADVTSTQPFTRENLCRECQCAGLSSSSVSEVYCHNFKDIFFIPAEVRADLRVLVLSHSKISSQFRRTNMLYRRLYKLEMTDSDIMSVERDAFRSFPRLKHLSLKDNHITLLDQKTFTNDKSLRTLILAGNKIRIPFSRPFLHAPQVTSLDLSRCEMNELPPVTFQNMTGLASLNLSHNSIDLFFGDEFEMLKNLSELNLDYNGLKLINKSTFNRNVRLKTLSLRGNYFLTLDCEGYSFLNIPSLEMLWLDQNELLTLPSYSFGNLKNLTYLSVNTNYLKTINFGDIAHLPRLRHVSALANNLQCGCVGEHRSVCCSWGDVEVAASCDGSSWDVAKTNTCREEFSFWGYLQPWQWKLLLAIVAGCFAMTVISLLLARGPCLRTKINLRSSVENIYL